MMTSVVFFCIIFVSILCYYLQRTSSVIYLSGTSFALISNKTLAIFIPILIISLLVGLRYDVGVDYLTYKDIFEYYISDDLIESLKSSGVEPVFTLLCVLLHKMNIPYYGMFIIMTLIPMYFFYRYFNTREYLFIPAMLLLYMSGVFFWYMNIMRQGISFFILLYAVGKLSDGSFFKYLFWVLIASGFHISSLLFLPLFLFYYIHKPLFERSVFMLIYIITWIFSKDLTYILLSLVEPFIEGYYLKYIDVINTLEMSGGTGLGVLALHISDIMLIYMSPLIAKVFVEERYELYYNIFLCGAIISNIAGMNMLLSRIPFCLISMRIIVAAFSIYYVYNHWRNLKMHYKLAFSICLVANIAYFVGNLINLEYHFVKI